MILVVYFTLLIIAWLVLVLLDGRRELRHTREKILELERELSAGRDLRREKGIALKEVFGEVKKAAEALDKATTLMEVK